MSIKSNTHKLTTQFSILQWILLLSTSLFLFIFPFHAALFNGYNFDFEKALLDSMIYTFILLLISGIRLFYNWKLDEHRSILSVIVLFLPIIYAISLFNAVESHDAKISFQIAFMTAAFFIVSIYIAEHKFHAKIIELAVQLSGYVIVIYGLLNLFGQVYYANALWLADANYRLTSVFQYSNSYAAFLAALFLGGLFSIINTKQWYWRALHSFMLVPIWISFMLTYSRAALVFIPILIIIILPFLKIGRQISFLIYTFLALVSSFAILSKITAIAKKISDALQPASGTGKTMSIGHSDPLAGWGITIAASLLVTIVIVLVHHKLTNWLDAKTANFAQKKWSIVAVPAFFVIIGALAAALVFTSSGVRSLLPQSIADRIESINFEQHSVLERETFYRDALKISADYPVIGAGGGAWTALYQKYQNNPYSSEQTHSYILNLLVETGWLGLIITVGFIVLVYCLFIRAYYRNPELRGNSLYFFIISLAILLHSTVDFDMSYAYLSAVVFLCLGAMLAPYSKQMLLAKFEAFKDSNWRYVYPSALSILAIVLFVFVYREYSANLSFNQSLYLAITEKKPLNDVLPPLDKAISIEPDNPDFTLRKIDWMSQAYNQTNDKQYLDEYKRLVDQLKPYVPYDRQLMLAEYKYYKLVGNYDKVLSLLDEAISKFQWDINFYEAAIMEYFIAGQQEGETNSNSTDSKWGHSLELYNQVLSQIEYLKTLPEGQLPGRDFAVTPLIRQAIGQIEYRNKNYDAAYNLLKEDSKGDLSDATIRINVRYYLASLDALGKSDKDLYNKLIEADENESKELQRLFDSN